MQPLMLHQTCDLGPIRAVTASIAPTSAGCEAEFRLDGRVDGIVIPKPAASVREDNLWKTTCFEIFWQPIGGTFYREFNLSPSGKWACYDFDSFREGMRDAPVEAIAVSCSHSGDELVLKASIAAELPDPAQVALNAIVEHPDGGLQFWALAFPPGKPEFHSEACRQMIVERD
ncbi:DOMON-like domain-containing protein [Erythrobacter sp. THAF29]|uniref:DOMON-like domain-containing protein n=1 Tax=Erythrobacter sp. THAF29 TaxID=2587851 RepID=UPI0012A95EE1|nr:DOMON-like domain-containing protein [Erythrobacter sp. THAF29]QFT77863.1 hypothetical protein FIU90_09980 [Erythrobacter sp. THAF29]